MEVTEGDLDPFLYITDETTEERVITSSANAQSLDGQRVISIRNLMLDSTGNYTITATRLGEALGATTGSYRLSIEPGIENVMSDTRQDAMIFDSEVVGATIDTGQKDAWYFDGIREQQVTVVVSDVSEGASQDGTSNEFSIDLQTYANDQWQSLTKSDSSLGEARFVNFPLPSSGRFAIVIESSEQLVYQLTLAGAGGTRDQDLPCQEPPPQCPSISPLGGAGIPLSNEVPASGSITAANPAIAYQFIALESNVITIEMQRTGGDLDTFLGLADVRGDILARDEGFDPGSSAINNFQISESGCYFAFASRAGVGDGTTEGTFIITVSGIPAAPGPVIPEPPNDITFGRDITPGDTVRGTIDNVDWQIAYRFQSEGGGSFTAIATRSEGTFNPALILLDSQGNEIDAVTANFVGNASNPLTFVAEADSFYFIVVRREDGESGSSSGDFSLTITPAN